MNKHYFFLAAFFILAGCQFQQPDYLNMVSANELNSIMQQQDILLIDVHTPEQRHIKGTDLFIPYDKIEENQEQLPADKNTPVYLYCASGPMGNAAARTLHKLGYTHLMNLQGGTGAWKNAELEFEK